MSMCPTQGVRVAPGLRRSMRSGTSCARRTIDPRSFPLPGRTITFRNCRCVVTRVRVIVSVRKRVCAQAFASVCQRLLVYRVPPLQVCPCPLCVYVGGLCAGCCSAAGRLLRGVSRACLVSTPRLLSYLHAYQSVMSVCVRACAFFAVGPLRNALRTSQTDGRIRPPASGALVF